MRKFGLHSKIVYLLISLSAITLLATFFVTPVSANLLVNPGFETGDITGWTSSSAFATIVSDPYLVHDGSWGGALDSSVVAPGSNASLTQTVLLPGAGIYEFGGWLRAFTVGSEIGVFDQIQISTWVFITSEGSTLGDSVAYFSNFQNVNIGSITRGSDWTFFTGSFNYTGPANGSVLFNFNLQNQYSNVVSTAAGDSFFLERVPEPATMLLLGIGLIGLAGMRRNIQ